MTNYKPRIFSNFLLVIQCPSEKWLMTSNGKNLSDILIRDKVIMTRINQDTINISSLSLSLSLSTDDGGLAGSHSNLN